MREPLPNCRDNLDAVWSVRKIEIGDDEVGAFRHCKRRHAIGDTYRMMACVTQEQLEKFADDGIVLDDKNRESRRRLLDGRSSARKLRVRRFTRAARLC